jgi:RNA polymerase sigma-70 factor (ECF subfamily)
MDINEYAALRTESPDKACRALFDEYCGYVYAVVYNKLGACASREDIEECVSDVFAEIWFGFDEKLAGGDIKGYIGTVAKRRAINRYHALHARSAASAATTDDVLGTFSDGTDIEADADRAEQQRILLSCIEALGEPDSTMIIQRYYYSRTSKQIAKMLSMKPSAVRMRIKRALVRLGELLRKSGMNG